MEFQHLDAETRRRLEERGIDVEKSLQGLLAEVRVAPPPKLLRDLALAPLVNERVISKGAWPRWNRAA